MSYRLAVSQEARSSEPITPKLVFPSAIFPFDFNACDFRQAGIIVFHLEETIARPAIREIIGGDDDKMGFDITSNLVDLTGNLVIVVGGGVVFVIHFSKGDIQTRTCIAFLAFADSNGKTLAVVAEEQGEGLHLLEQTLAGAISLVEHLVDFLEHVGLGHLPIEQRIFLVDFVHHGIAPAEDLATNFLMILNLLDMTKLIS